MVRCRIAGSACLDPAARAAAHCARPGFDTSTWTGEDLFNDWLGAPPMYDQEPSGDRDGRGDWFQPYEDVEREGCPGAWYRTPFVASLWPYLRRQDDNGGRVSNPLLDRTSDRLVLEAVALAEVYEESAHAEHLKLVYRPRDDP